MTMRRFAAIDRLATWLMAPYLAWVTFAAALNAAIYRLQ
jgi:tryptophan-rich sensory protein